MNERYLSQLDFELAYLALLTRYGLKRLSRWEPDIAPHHIDILRDFGLEVAIVRRRLLFGRKTRETVFSTGKRWTDLYRTRFEMTRIRESPEQTRLRGFLFGYPSCCVEAFIQKPYSKNHLPPRDQRILFHWACSGCKVTPGLLKEYRSIYDECLGLFAGIAPERRKPFYRRRPYSHSSLTRLIRGKALPAAACLSGLLLLPQAGYNHERNAHHHGDFCPDPHLRSVENDGDQDYLSYTDEMFYGVDPRHADTDGDGLLDGISQAYRILQTIEALPGYWAGWDDPADYPTDRQYLLVEGLCGVLTCPICEKTILMDLYIIVNPMKGTEMIFSYPYLHFLEHGSLWTWGGPRWEHQFDISLFEEVMRRARVYPHQLPISTPDSDLDGLDGCEEALLGTDPANPDTDGNSLKDGHDVATQLMSVLSSLPRQEQENEPYLIEEYATGAETCERCRAVLNSGHVRLVNPVNDLSLDIPFIALHYMAHGGSVYGGSLHDGRVPPVFLNTVLMGDGTSHWLEVEGDTDGDGLKDAEEPHFSLDPLLSDSDSDGIPDGPQLAMLMWNIIDGLPEGSHPDQTYLVHHLAYGMYNCLICDEAINMGYMEIVNPNAGTNVEIPYYSLHFMRHGSFSTDRLSVCPRIDPRDIEAVLDISSYASVGHPQIPAAMLRVFPNPFSKSTHIHLNIPDVPDVKVVIYDARGRCVNDLSSASQSARKTTWDGTGSNGERLNAGVYFCKVSAGELTLSKKIVLVN
jgi:hypothetical protein